MIGWITGHWGLVAGIGGGGLLVIALAIWFLAPAMIPLVGKAVIGWAKWAWSHPQAVLSLTLAGVAGYGLLDSYGARQRIVVIQQKTDKCVADLAVRDNTIAGYEAQQKTFADAAREQAKNLATAQQQSVDAQALLARQQAAAEASNAGWVKVYNARPQSCKASLEAMAVACNSVEKDY